MKNEWKCCDCPKIVADKHEVLYSFTQYGNNEKKKADALKGKERCKEHFDKVEAKFSR
jgi:hypothetical protein